MAKACDEHPTPEQLVAYGLGLAEPDEQRWVETHIEQCDSCCQALEQIPDDTLLGRIRSCDTSVLEATNSPGQTRGDGGGPLAELQNHPRYRLVKLLGRGGMGVVYQAEHRLMHRMVALKVINRRLLTSDRAIERFRREVRNAARLSHPNIVMAHDAEQVGNIHLLVMEYVDGVNLAEHVAAHGPLPVAPSCDMARQVALGLQHASEQGMVHRDIKPHNLMRTPDGQIKILDFGLARFASEGELHSEKRDQSLTAGGMMLGTPDYAAPEQILDARKADIRADIYSLGATLYFLLTGSPPFPDGSAAEKMSSHLHRAPTRLDQSNPSIPQGLAELVERLLRKEPHERYQTPAEVAEALQPYCPDAPAAPPAPPPLPLSAAGLGTSAPVVVSTTTSVKKMAMLPAGRRRNRSLLIGMGIAGIVLLAALIAPLFRQDTDPDVVAAAGEKRVLIVVPWQNFWGPDYFELRKHLDTASVQVVVASSRPGRAVPASKLTPVRYDPIKVDTTLDRVKADDFDAVIFTGAYPNESMEFVHDPEQSSLSHDLIRAMLVHQKIVSSICGGTEVLVRSGVLDGKEVAWNDYLPADLAENRHISKDRYRPCTRVGNIITARGYQDGWALAEELHTALK